MTQEEKAKAYDEIIEKAIKMHSENCEACKMCIEELIPELKESEDEMIRKALIHYMKDYSDGTGLIHAAYGVSRNDAIAWLEKQGNLMGALQEANKKIGELVEENYYLKEQGEQKPQRMVSAEAKEAMYDKPAWSEEDDKKINYLIALLQNGTIHNPALRTVNEELENWLKSLKDRVQPQPKQEWSEEDERLMKNLKSTLANLSARKLIERETEDKYVNWLKSLRPQNRWEPSDEQVDALHYVTNFDYGGYKATLVSLYEQLKRLKE